MESQRIDMDAWGNETAKTVNPATPQQKATHRFTTYERDANGTDEAMHRRYNSVRSRFDQPDPYDGSYNLTNPQSFNRYTYTQNDPVNFVDPSGLVESWNYTSVGTWDAGTIYAGYDPLAAVDGSVGGPDGSAPGGPPEDFFDGEGVGIGGEVDDTGGTSTGTTPQNTVPPRSGPCNLVTPGFAELQAANPAAHNLLTATYGNNAASTYASWGTYNQAVFLNTIGAVAAQGANLSNARISGFYYGDSPDRAPFGVKVTGVTTQSLDSAGLGDSLLYGRRSPGSIKEGSLEATVQGNTVAFDVDLYNIKSNKRKHIEEVNYNRANKTTTHPADALRKLNGRGVSTGVKCQ